MSGSTDFVTVNCPPEPGKAWVRWQELRWIGTAKGARPRAQASHLVRVNARFSRYLGESPVALAGIAKQVRSQLSYRPSTLPKIVLWPVLPTLPDERWVRAAYQGASSLRFEL